jgi:isoleucyl-tRNA synthetase
VRQLAGFARGGLLYRAKRPVHWCVTHQTALAEAEVEYAEHTSPSIYVRFPLEPGQPAVEAIFGKTPAALVIWTTTPWTLAANLAVVANPELDYVGIPSSAAARREYLVVAKGRPRRSWPRAASPRRRRARGSESAASASPACAGSATATPSSRRRHAKDFR